MYVLLLQFSSVGVGDGPWGILEEYDDHLPSRSWDNCQCVVWEHVKKKYRRDRNYHFVSH